MVSSVSDGAHLALLLLAGFRSLVDDLHAELARQGHPDARPLHGFALQAIGPDGASVSEVGRRLGVSKQAAGKTVGALERLGYAVREAHPTDARSARVSVTEPGRDLLRRSAEIFGELRDAWAARVGADELAGMERALATLVGSRAVRLDVPGWLAAGDGSSGARDA
jgi:DNA-binding MarR family transcriptional regulator